MDQKQSRLGHHVAAVLRAEIARAGIKNQDVIDRSGLSASTVGRILRGVRGESRQQATIEQVAAIAYAIGIPVAQILADAEAATVAEHPGSAPLTSPNAMRAVAEAGRAKVAADDAKRGTHRPNRNRKLR